MYFSSLSNKSLKNNSPYSICKTSLFLCGLFVLTCGSPLPDPELLQPNAARLLQRRSLPIITNSDKICYPKSAEDKLTQLQEQQGGNSYSLKIMDISVDDGIQHVGILPATLKLMSNDDLSSCIVRSKVVNVPELFPPKIMMTECDTSCTLLEDNEQLRNEYVSISVLRRSQTDCKGKVEDWKLDSIDVPQCRRFVIKS